MHKISRVRILEMCQVQDIIQTMDLRRIKWLEKLSFMDFSRCPRAPLRMLDVHVWQSIPSQWKASQNYWTFTYRQFKTYRRGIVSRRRYHDDSSIRAKAARYYCQPSCSRSLSTHPIGILASDNGEVFGHGSRFLLYLQAIGTWKDSTEKDEKDSQRAINSEQ